VQEPKNPADRGRASVGTAWGSIRTNYRQKVDSSCAFCQPPNDKEHHEEKKERRGKRPERKNVRKSTREISTKKKRRGRDKKKEQQLDGKRKKDETHIPVEKTSAEEWEISVKKHFDSTLCLPCGKGPLPEKANWSMTGKFLEDGKHSGDAEMKGSFLKKKKGETGQIQGSMDFSIR